MTTNSETSSHDKSENKSEKKEQVISKSEEKTCKYCNLVLSGGSVKGIAHVGALNVLVEKGLIDLKKLESVAGTSAGSMLGLLIVLGFTTDEVRDFLYELDISSMFNPDLSLVLKKCGIETGQTVCRMFEDILYERTRVKHINFRQLFEITGIHFIVVGSCLTTKEAVYYDHLNTPNFKVSMAIRISIGIPGFFTPVAIGSNRYIDGGVINDYPMNLFVDRLDKTVGILINNEFSTEYSCPEEYFMAIISLFFYRYYNKSAEQWADNTVCIKHTMDNINMLSFDIDYDSKVKLYEAGENAALDFINKKQLAD